MPEAVAERNTEQAVVPEKTEKEKVRERQKERREKREKEKARNVSEKQAKKQRAIEKAERDAAKTLDDLRESRLRATKPLEPNELLADYDALSDLEARLGNSSDEVKDKIQTQIDTIKNELLTHGIAVAKPESELHAIAHMPSTYSAEFLNNITEAALGVSVVEADVQAIQAIKDGDTIKTIQVPRHDKPLTIEETLEIVRAITSADVTFLEKRAEDILRLGQDLQDLATYLARPTKNGGSIFDSAEQKQAMADLYNAGGWLKKLIRPQETEKPIQWHELREKGKTKGQEIQEDPKDPSKKRKKELMGLLFGKNKYGASSPTYERLLKHYQAVHENATEDDFADWLATRGAFLVSQIAPQIAESFAKGKGAAAIARGVGAIGRAAPKVIFESGRDRIGQVALPENARAYIQEKSGLLIAEEQRHLLGAASKLREQLKNPDSDFSKKSPQEQLALLNRMVQYFHFPGETNGKKVSGYALADVFANSDAEIGCSIRSYLLANIMQEVYGKDGANVVANTLFLPSDGGKLTGHTRLQVVIDGQIFIVDPSEQRGAFGINTGVKQVFDEDLKKQIAQVVATGKSQAITLPESTEPNAVSNYQIIGTAFTSQEANMLANIAAATSNEEQKKQMNMLALQFDPNNQVALLHLAALTPGTEERSAYIERVQQINPALRNTEVLANALAQGKEIMVGANIDPALYPNLPPQIGILLTTFITTMGVGSLDIGNDPRVTAGSLAQLYDIVQRQRDIFVAGLVPPITAAQQNQINAANGVLSSINEETVRAVARENATAINAATRPALRNPEVVTNQADALRIMRDTLAQIFKDPSATSGWGDFGSPNYQLLGELQLFIARLNPGTIGKSLLGGNPANPPTAAETLAGNDVINQLRAELHVRTAGWDVDIAAKLGSNGVQAIVNAELRFSQQEFQQIEGSIPDVGNVRMLYEQVAQEILTQRGSIGVTDYEEMRRMVDIRWAAIRGRPGVNNLTEDDRIALELGRNIFVLRIRLAHTIALGKPVEVAPGLAIGNSPWDFAVQVFDFKKWVAERYGALSEEGEAYSEIVNLTGNELSLSDHDSGWRIGEYIRQANRAGLNKQFLFMRLLYNNDIDINKNKKAFSQADRNRIMKDIITYCPEGLVSIFREDPTIRGIIERNGGVDYQNFLTEILRQRMICIDAGRYDYAGFTMAGNAVYGELQRFLNQYASDLATPDRNLTLRSGNGTEVVPNPLFATSRVYYMGDAPFHIIDTLGGGAYNEQMVNAFGGGTTTREWNNLQAASEGMGKLLEFINNPTPDNLAKLRGVFSKYKDVPWESKFIGRLARASFQFVGENLALRLAMPGVDRLLGWLMGGGSRAQKIGGPFAESLDTVEMETKIKELQAKGILTPEEARKVREMMQISLLFKSIPLVQIVVVTIIAGILKTALGSFQKQLSA